METPDEKKLTPEQEALLSGIILPPDEPKKPLAVDMNIPPEAAAGPNVTVDLEPVINMQCVNCMTVLSLDEVEFFKSRCFPCFKIKVEQKLKAYHKKYLVLAVALSLLGLYSIVSAAVDVSKVDAVVSLVATIPAFFVAVWIITYILNLTPICEYSKIWWIIVLASGAAACALFTFYKLIYYVLAVICICVFLIRDRNGIKADRIKIADYEIKIADYEAREHR